VPEPEPTIPTRLGPKAIASASTITALLRSTDGEHIGSSDHLSPFISSLPALQVQSIYIIHDKLPAGDRRPVGTTS